MINEAYIVHLFTVCGGGERTSLEIAQALRSLGISVTYVTNSKKGLWECADLFGYSRDFDVIEARSVMESLLSLTGRFVRYRRLLLLSKLFESMPPRGENSITIDSGTNGLFSVDVSYVHYPVTLGPEKSNGPHWLLYNWFVSRKAWKMMRKDRPPRLVLVNSSWTRRLVRETYGIDSIVLYPPVDVDYFAYDNRKKEKIIVTVSRLTPEKNLHFLPKVASKLPDYDWYLVGSTGIRKLESTQSKLVVKRIKDEINKHGAIRFHILENLPRGELRELLRGAMFYVHPPFAEHFGISIVEGMAAGAIPIIYRDGGAWSDVVSKVNALLGYSDILDIHRIIRTLENSLNLPNLREQCIEIAHEYSAPRFREKFLDIVKTALLRHQ